MAVMHNAQHHLWIFPDKLTGQEHRCLYIAGPKSIEDVVCRGGKRAAVKGKTYQALFGRLHFQTTGEARL